MIISCSGEKWASVWNPELGVRERQGDKLCTLAAERLNVTSFPNQQFPRGIMVSSLFRNIIGGEYDCVARILLQYVRLKEMG